MGYTGEGVTLPFYSSSDSVVVAGQLIFQCAMPQHAPQSAPRPYPLPRTNQHTHLLAPLSRRCTRLRAVKDKGISLVPPLLLL